MKQKQLQGDGCKSLATEMLQCLFKQIADRRGLKDN